MGLENMRGNNVKMRAATENDMTTIWELLQQLSPFLPDRHDAREIWTRFVSQSHLFTCVALVDGTLVGYGCGFVQTTIRGGSFFQIEEIVVASTHQRMGIGGKIVAYLELSVASKNCYKAILSADDKTVKFYERLGYSEVHKTFRKFL